MDFLDFCLPGFALSYTVFLKYSTLVQYCVAVYDIVHHIYYLKGSILKKCNFIN